MTDYAPAGNSHPDKVFQWVDENDVRCGPRHKTLKAAVSYRSQCINYIGVENKEDDYLFNRKKHGFDNQRKDYPSQKMPVKLQIGEWISRDMTTEEQTTFEQVIELMNKGWV